MQIHNAVITGSFSYNGADLSNVTSSNAYSASLSSRTTNLESTSSVLVGASSSFSSILTSVSSSQQQISGSLLNFIAIGATTGSNSFRATQSITGSLTVTGQIVAQSLNVQQVTSSIVFSSGSNTFGCDLNSRQTFTGSVIMTGSLTVNTTGTELQVNNNGVILGNLLTDNHSITGSLRITGSNVIIAGALCGTNSTFTSFTQASNFISDGNQFFSFTLKGRASDNFGAIGFYNNSGATRVGYIQSGTICGGQVNITADGGGSITLDNRGINATGATTFTNDVVINGRNTVVSGLVAYGSNNSGSPAALGTSTAKFQLMNGGVYGMVADVLTNGNTYFQSQRVDGNTAAYNLLLQPLGGCVGIGIISPNEKLDVNGAIQVRGESLGYATTQCVGMLDFYANTTRILSFGGNATTCGCFRFYSAAQNNAGGSDVAIINGGGAACFRGAVCASQILTPNQPSATVGITFSYGTAATTIPWNYVYNNVGGHYNSSTGYFTAPVSGMYLTSIMVMSDSVDVTMDIGLYINNNISNALVPYQSCVGGPYNQVSGMTIISLSANDTISYRINGGSIYGSAAGRHNSVVFRLLG